MRLPDLARRDPPTCIAQLPFADKSATSLASIAVPNNHDPWDNFVISRSREHELSRKKSALHTCHRSDRESSCRGRMRRRTSGQGTSAVPYNPGRTTAAAPRPPPRPLTRRPRPRGRVSLPPSAASPPPAPPVYLCEIRLVMRNARDVPQLLSVTYATRHRAKAQGWWVGSNPRAAADHPHVAAGAPISRKRSSYGGGSRRP